MLTASESFSSSFPHLSHARELFSICSFKSFSSRRTHIIIVNIFLLDAESAMQQRSGKKCERFFRWLRNFSTAFITHHASWLGSMTFAAVAMQTVGIFCRLNWYYDYLSGIWMMTKLLRAILWTNKFYRKFLEITNWEIF